MGIDIQVRALSEEEGGGFEAWSPRWARSLVGYGRTKEAAVKDFHQGIDYLRLWCLILW